MSQISIPPPGLQEATKNSTSVWQENLEELFRNAKDRFPDVVWEVDGSDMMKEMEMETTEEVEEVWGHKAIVYARAPPSFQTRYFSFRQPITTSFPAGNDDYPDESDSIQPDTRTLSPSPSSTTTTAISQPAPTTSLLRLTSSINSALFSNELEYLYTGKGFGEAFEFLFDSSESSSRDRHLRGVDDQDDPDDHADPEELRIDKLRKDLVFMWRSRLYSDVRIALTGSFSSSSTAHGETTTAIFSSHRFILISRSPYFHTALLSWPSAKSQPPAASPSEPPILNLPSPPFTPASLHFTLGFIYTGTLIFSHRSYDLSTAFAILRSALYLQLYSLQDEIQARIVQEMLHGLFHAFISFEEYERLTGGKWGTGGCRCRLCARRVPRVLEFALADDVQNQCLERGCRRALVGLFGEGWANQEFSSLSVKNRETILRGLAKRTTPLNIFPLLFAAEHGLGKLGAVIDPWGDISREMISSARKTIDEVLCKESEACFNSEEWMELMEADGVRFQDEEKVGWAMAAVLRGVKEAFAPSLYQTLVSSILLRPHPTDVNAPLLPATSPIRSQVEQTRLELLKWIGKRWLGIRQERAFDALEGWALKEISDHIEVPIEDLFNPPTQAAKHSPKRPGTTTSLLRPASQHPHTSKVDAESDAASSMRVSVLSRSMRQTSTNTTTTTKDRDNNGLASSASSVRSAAVRSCSESYASAMSGNTIGGRSNGGMSPAKMIVKETRAGGSKERPDSKSTASVVSPLVLEPEVLEDDDGMEEEEEDGEEEEEYDDESRNGDEPEPGPAATPQLIKKVLITRASLASVNSRSTLSSLAGSGTGSSVSARPVSSASSVRSQSTIRRSMVSSVGSSRLNVTPTKSPVPRSTTSRPHRISTTSTNTRPISSVSSTTDSTATYRTAPNHRSRRTSGASMVSVRTLNGGGSTKPNSPVERTRRMSGASVSSVASNTGSVKSTRVRTQSTGRKPVSGASSGATSPLPAVDRKRLSPNVPRPGSIQSSVSGGSTASNSTSRKAVRKVVVKKTSDDDDQGSSSSPLPPVEVPVQELEAEVETEPKGVEEEKMMDVEVDKGDVKDEEQDDEIEDVIVEDPPLPNTSSTMTVKPKDRPSMDPTATTSMGSDHKKSSSSTSTASVMTLKRKGSSDTIKTVKSSSPPAPIIGDAPLTKSSSSDAVKSVKSASSSDAPLAKQLPPTPPSSHPTPSPPPPPPLQHQSSTLHLPTGVVDENRVIVPQGVTLDIGIPCIIASKRKRFKAYARYIGEVEGETGAWVGVEVPMPFGDSTWMTASDRSSGDNKVMNHQQGDDRQWNDGSWGGIRYFEIGGMGGSEWGDYGGTYNEDRASRRRRIDGGLSMSGSGSAIWSNGGSNGGGGGRGDKGLLKREGDQLSIASASEMRRKKFRSVSPTVSDMSGVETRGLFVRPQQVLYVVDAVGADL